MSHLPIPKLTDEQLKRFWAKVNKREPDACWEWTAWTIKGGYGQYRIGDSKYLTHRISYSIANGDPGKLCVCHRCDNPKCVNPIHLWLGTLQEDMKDRDQKGRQARGETQGLSELTENQVREIIASGDSHQGLANQYGVTRANISYIKRGETWKHIKGNRVQDTTRSRKDSTVGVRGVSPEGSKFKARIQVNGRRRHLGIFETVEEAAKAVQKARLL